jgi:hypothetical protein
MALTQQLAYEQLRSINSSTLSGSYQAVGTSFAHPICIMKMVNNSTSLVTVSVDGVNDYDVLPATSFFLYDATTNASKRNDVLVFPQGTQIYVKGSAGTGLIYLVCLYNVIG